MREWTAREWALAYAGLGWRVFPVVPSAKRPLYSGWQRDATTSRAIIERFWRREPGPNVGLICGEAFDAFDFEAEHLPRLKAWLRAHGHRLPVTPIALTGRRGIHILVRPRTGQGGHVLRLDGHHVGELKSAGGFIVACPSQTTGPYGWRRSPLDFDVGVAPAWLWQLADAPARAVVAGGLAVIGPQQGEVRLAALARTVRAASEGRRNNVLYWAMRRAIDDGIPAPIAANVLNRMATEAGLDGREVEQTIASAELGATR